MQKYWYDLNGNMTTRIVDGNTYNLSYDAESRLVGVSGATSASFVYDGDGNRVKGIVNGTTTTYVGSYFEWTGSIANSIRYYYAGSQRIAMRVGNGTQTEGVYWLLSDHLGSTNITADKDGIKYSELRYKAWGENRYTWGSTPTTYRYTGQRQESSFGLYFYNARWYDPALGRFAQTDPIIPETKQGVQAWDRYAYVNNNPFKYIDPSGNDADCMTRDSACRLQVQKEYEYELINKISKDKPSLENLSTREKTILISIVLSEKLVGVSYDINIIENKEISLGDIFINSDIPNDGENKKGQMIAGAVLIIFVDFFVGLPAAYVIFTTGGGSPPAIAAIALEIFVVLPANAFGIYLIDDARRK